MSHRHKPSPPTGWTCRFKDPRIVRVSKAEGGASKDRHSKVCTVRGLRDRRVRLSVPTAIQLYDLQERLGLNQPSKVVDWLLNAAKHDIDELPPLSQVPIMMTMMMGSSSDPNSERISNFHAFRPEEDWVVDVKSSMDKIMTPDVTYNSIFRDASGFTLPRSLRVDQHENIPLQGPALSTNVPTFGFHHQQQDSRGVPPARDYGMQSTSQ